MGRRRAQPSSLPAQERVAQALQRYRPLLSADDYEKLLEALNQPLHPAIRINPLKVNPPAALADWSTRYGWQTAPVPYCPTGCRLTSVVVPPSQTIEHRLGQLYIQEAASMLPVELFTPPQTPLPLALDMAASPGGKTTHLIERMGDRGVVIANDASASRIPALRLVVHTWGATSAAITRFPGEYFGAWFPETFDRVLLDAPCSMEGLRSSESHPMRAISPGERSRLAQRQVRLLESAFHAARVGGEIVYATCTLAPEENEAVLDALLQRYPDAVELIDLNRRLPLPSPALTGDGNRQYLPAVQRAARLWPHRYGTAGFFAALLVKRSAIKVERAHPPERALERSGLLPLSRSETARLADELLQAYGFDLTAVLESHQLTLLRRGSEVNAIPAAYLRHFASLPLQALGLPLGETGAGGFVPGHEWVSRFFNRFNAGRSIISTDSLSAWLRGEDLPLPANLPAGRGAVVLVEDESGRFLGRGKLLADRLRNLLPRRAVI
ncbi:MAG: hypothetical protein U1B80_09910 [Anaerolineaceae bacterium]|nr:hypothetical protein [Anaerolineaceae bacterium]